MRHSSVRIISGVSCVFFAAAAWHVGSHSSSSFTAQAQTAKREQLHRAGATISSPLSTTPSKTSTTKSTAQAAPIPLPVAAPGTEVYSAKRGETIATIARHFLGRTSYLTSSELSEAIRAANKDLGGAADLKANQNLVIPGILAAPITEKTIAVPRDFEVRAIYLTGIMAASDHGLRIIKHWREVGGNSVVFDIKDSDGSVTIPFEHPLLGKHQIYIHDVPKFVHFLHQQNMHAIARIAMFRDEHLVVTHPELAVQSRKNKTAWRENGKLVWTDPSNPTVQDYDIALAKHVAQLGVDEIQFDYVRFPAEGDQKDASFVYQQDSCSDSHLGCPAEAKQGGTSREAEPELPEAKHQAAKQAVAPKGIQRTDVITAFLKKAYAELHPTGVLLSLDVFGVMAWQRQVDLSHTGQDIVGMAHYCDVLSPMIYPSHFFGMDNIPHPGDEPAHFIGESMARFELITHPDGNLSSGVVIRPWLQAFHWRTKTYSPEYIKIQVATAREKGGIGFLFWNAANDYSKPYEAMPEMKAEDAKAASKDKAKYLRGDEIGQPVVHAALATGN